MTGVRPDPEIPDLRVEIAFNVGYGAAPVDRVWTDVSDKVEGPAGAAISYGRADEQQTVPPSTVTLTLNNTDGEFTPGRIGSPYYPNVRLWRPIRITAVYSDFESVRFTGFVSEWPVVWPDGADTYCNVTITAVSRRARMGQTRPLPSAIRAAILATSPDTYWPLDEDSDVTDVLGRPAFRDITNWAVEQYTKKDTQFLGVFYANDALEPSTEALRIVQHGTQSPHPSDEEALPYFPSFSNVSYLSRLMHYIGSGNTISVNSSGELTMEAVAKLQTREDVLSLATIMDLRTSDAMWGMFFYLAGVGLPEANGLYGEMMFRDPVTAAVLDDQTGYLQPGTAEAFKDAIDGQIHHFAMTLEGGKTGRFYFDGKLLHSITLASSYVFNRRFTRIVIGSDTLNVDLWEGHVALHDRALTADEIATRAVGATAASEELGERVARVATYVGIPVDEIDVEPTTAAPLGPQAEAGRSSIDVIEEAATSTGGVLFDSRVGVLTLHARSHRYNQPLAFVLSAADDEIEPDLNPALDDQGMVNTVELTDPSGNPLVLTDQASVDEYGDYRKPMTVVSTSATEVEAAGLHQLSRYAEPSPRIKTVSIDVGDLIPEQRAGVLAADIGTRFGLRDLPGQAPELALPLFFEGATESITTSGHTLTVNTSPGDRDDVWILGDPVFSVLGRTTRMAY